MMDADGLNHEQCGPYAYTSCSLNSASLVGQIVLRINTWMAPNQFALANDLEPQAGTMLDGITHARSM